MIYSILLFRLHKCNISLDRYKNKVITSVEFDTMKKTYAELSEISFTEVEVRCAIVIALVHNNNEVDNRTIANTLWVDMTISSVLARSWRVRIPVELSQGSKVSGQPPEVKRCRFCQKG